MVHLFILSSPLVTCIGSFPPKQFPEFNGLLTLCNNLFRASWWVLADCWADLFRHGSLISTWSLVYKKMPPRPQSSSIGLYFAKNVHFIWFNLVLENEENLVTCLLFLWRKFMNAESAAGRDELFDSAKPQQGQMLTDRQTEKPMSPSTLIYILYAQKIHPTSYIHSWLLTINLFP